MRSLLWVLAILLPLVAGVPDSAHAQSLPGVIDRQALRGKAVPIYRVRFYQADRGCTARAAPAIDVSPRPRLGRVTSVSSVLVGDGPCGRMEYPVLTVIYTAGPNSGVDEFELFFFDSYGGGLPERLKMRIFVR